VTFLCFHHGPQHSRADPFIFETGRLSLEPGDMTSVAFWKKLLPSRSVDFFTAERP
jgi:hypothetical protein